MDIGQRIKRLREEKKLTQKELALKIDMNYSVLSRIESGERPIRDEEIIRISEALSVSTDYLLGHSNIKNPYKKKDNLHKLDLDPKTVKLNKIARYAKDLDESDQEMVIGLLESLRRAKGKGGTGDDEDEI